MRPRELTNFLIKTLPAGYSTLTVGAPGIGKTDIWHQATATIGYELLVSHPAVSDPTDYKGMPGIFNGLADFLPFGDLRRKSRFTSIVHLEPNIQDWTDWAAANGVSPEVIAFARFKPELITSPGEPSADIVNRPSPRTVVNLDRIYKLGFTDLESLSGSAGEGFATEFVGFLRLWRELPNLDGILLDPSRANVPNGPSALIAVATGIAAKANPQNVDRVFTYLDRLPDEYNVYGGTDVMRRFPKLAANQTVIDWAVKHQDFLRP